MDGMITTRKIRELPGAVVNIPIIALTANAMKGDCESYLEAGMSDYLAKPVRPAQLMSMLAKWRHVIPSNDPNQAVEEVPLVEQTLVLDADILDALSDAVGHENLSDLIEHGLADIRANVTKICELGDARDLDAIWLHAHNLKSVAGGFGAIQLQNLVEDIGLACRESRDMDVIRLCGEIASTADETVAALEAKIPSRTINRYSAWPGSTLTSSR
jgi:CheY-like chemotaxis protein